VRLPYGYVFGRKDREGGLRKFYLSGRMISSGRNFVHKDLNVCSQ
jgi:hypothetical protein